jgi:hypothetical protein
VGRSQLAEEPKGAPANYPYSSVDEIHRMDSEAAKDPLFQRAPDNMRFSPGRTANEKWGGWLVGIPFVVGGLRV